MSTLITLPFLAQTSLPTDADSLTKVGDRLVEAFASIVQLLPALAAMLLVLAVGYVISRWAARGARLLAERVGLQKAAERSGLTESMQHVGIQNGVAAIVGQIVFWLLMCVFLMAAFNIVNLPTLSAAMQGLVGYIPRLLAATVVVVIGLLIASFLRGAIATGADRLGLSYAERLATACYYVLAAMTFIAAFEQLEIRFALLEQVILIAFGAVAVGFGLALGLGGRDVVGGILAGHYVRQRMHSGDHVHLNGMDGIVREVGPVATVVETEAGGMKERHTVPNSRMLAEAIR